VGRTVNAPSKILRFIGVTDPLTIFTSYTYFLWVNASVWSGVNSTITDPELNGGSFVMVNVAATSSVV
jgi:hypothetical protein